MKRLVMIFSLLSLLSVCTFAQADKLIGRWEGKINSPQGERDIWVEFKKEGDMLTGSAQGMRPGSEAKLTDIKVEDDKVTAKTNIETPNGAIPINYTFKLAGDTLNGEGTLDFNGNAFSFEINLKRAGAAAATTGQGSTTPPGQTTPRRASSVAQPQQQQSIDYFVGQWSYKYLGRESALGIAPRECTLTFTKRDANSVAGVTECQADGKTTKSTSLIVYDAASKFLTMTETLPGKIRISSKGDWTSPIAIRFTVNPIKTKNQALQLKRTYSIVAGHSFTIAEELSEDGGPFVRLGSAVVSKIK